MELAVKFAQDQTAATDLIAVTMKIVEVLDQESASAVTADALDQIAASVITAATM